MNPVYDSNVLMKALFKQLTDGEEQLFEGTTVGDYSFDMCNLTRKSGFLKFRLPTLDSGIKSDHQVNVYLAVINKEQLAAHIEAENAKSVAEGRNQLIFARLVASTIVIEDFESGLIDSLHQLRPSRTAEQKKILKQLVRMDTLEIDEQLFKERNQLSAMRTKKHHLEQEVESMKRRLEIQMLKDQADTMKSFLSVMPPMFTRRDPELMQRREQLSTEAGREQLLNQFTTTMDEIVISLDQAQKNLERYNEHDQPEYDKLEAQYEEVKRQITKRRNQLYKRYLLSLPIGVKNLKTGKVEPIIWYQPPEITPSIEELGLVDFESRWTEKKAKDKKEHEELMASIEKRT